MNVPEPVRPRVATERRERRGRLSRSADFDRVYREGRSQANRHLVLHVFERDDAGEARLGVSVSRKLGGAVVRNRVKRLLREAFRTRSASVTRGRDLVVVARADVATLAQESGLEGVACALDELLARCGLVGGEVAEGAGGAEGS